MWGVGSLRAPGLLLGAVGRTAALPPRCPRGEASRFPVSQAAGGARGAAPEGPCRVRAGAPPLPASPSWRAPCPSGLGGRAAGCGRCMAFLAFDGDCISADNSKINLPNKTPARIPAAL